MILLSQKFEGRVSKEQVDGESLRVPEPGLFALLSQSLG